MAVYEAGYFGFRLHRPSGESWHPLSGYSSEFGLSGKGNRVKTGKQMLNRVLVPSEQPIALYRTDTILGIIDPYPPLQIDGFIPEAR